MSSDDATPSASVGSSHPFTCNTCQVAFRTSETQRTHMQTDWHRYNLKRRVASLPPLESEIFAEKVLATQASAAATAAKASFEKFCSICQKRFYSENAFRNHLGSQKHRTRLGATETGNALTNDDETLSVMSSTFSLGEPVGSARNAENVTAAGELAEVINGIQTATIIDNTPLAPRPSSAAVVPAENRAEQVTPSLDGTDQFSPSRCLFCNYDSPSLELNVDHMSVIHGMFIPEREYLVDLVGLLRYLYDKIAGLHECIFCSQAKHTFAGIQTHMRDKGHCMIAFESEEDMIEVGQYYDFSSTYSDDESESMHVADRDQKGGVKLGARRSEVVEVLPGEEADEVGDDDEGWESGSALSSVPTEELGSVPIDPRTHHFKTLDQSHHHSHRDPRPHHNSDGWHSRAHSKPHAVYYDEYELHLPTGRVAGHRSLNKFFRQNLRGYPTPAERASRRAIMDASAPASDSDDDNLRRRDEGRQMITRANGGLGMVGVSDERKREIRAVETRERKREQRARAKYQWGNEKRANFQKHYRDPLLQ